MDNAETEDEDEAAVLSVPSRKMQIQVPYFTLQRSFLVIFCIFCIFYKFQHIQHMFHILHILPPHILHVLQELHKISVMDGWQGNRLGQEGASAGPAAVPASAAGPAAITSDAWPRCSCMDTAAACLQWIAKTHWVSTHNAFKFDTALQKLALTYLLQYAEYAKKSARKYA